MLRRLTRKKPVRAIVPCSTEYAVYVFHRPGRMGRGHWAKMNSTADILSAQREAENLSRSGDFERVEIKKKYFNARLNQNIEMTLKSFSAPKKIFGRVTLTMALLVALAGVALFFLF